jgi:ribosomal protein S4
MVLRDFSHPLVKMVYDKIGSWTLTNGKEDDIQRKAKEHYTECIAEFSIKPQEAWLKLESFNAKPKELPPSDKIPTAQERKSFKERLAEYQKKLEEAKIACGGIPYKEFDENKIKKGGREFDQAVYNEWRDYLISIPEEQTMILPVKYLYERNRFLNMLDQKKHLDKAGYVPESQRTPQEQPRTGNGKPTKIYKNWSD